MPTGSLSYYLEILSQIPLKQFANIRHSFVFAIVYKLGSNVVVFK